MICSSCEPFGGLGKCLQRAPSQEKDLAAHLHLTPSVFLQMHVCCCTVSQVADASWLLQQIVLYSEGAVLHIILLAMCKPPEAMHALQALLLSHPRKMTRDTATYPPLMMSVGKGQKAKSRSLRHLAETELGLSIQAGEHSPVDDARSTLYLYHKHRKVCACSFCLDQLHCKEPGVHDAPASGAVSRVCLRLLTHYIWDAVF